MTSERFTNLAPEDYDLGVEFMSESLAGRGISANEHVRKIAKGGLTPRSAQASYAIAEIVNPIDRATKLRQYESREVRAAVRLGLSASLLLIEHSYHPEIIHQDAVWASSIELAAPETGDDMHDQHVLAASVIDQAGRGVSLAGAKAEEWLDEVASDTVEDITLHTFFKAGSGLALLGADNVFSQRLEARRQKLLQKLESATPGAAVDWDLAARDLFK